MEPEKVQEELENFRNRYQSIINQQTSTRVEMNEARAILFLTGNLYCEQVAVGAIKRRLHLLPKPFSLVDFFMVIDSKSERLEQFRKHKLFDKMERYYEVIKKYKNRHIEEKYYLEKEKFLKKYKEMSPNPEMRIGYKWDFK